MLAPDVPPSSDVQGGAHARGCILVVEDDPAIATVLEVTLTAEAYEAVRTGAARALRLARELHPDVVLPGSAMPDMDGCRPALPSIVRGMAVSSQEWPALSTSVALRGCTANLAD